MNVMKAVCTGIVAICLGATSLTSVSAAPLPSIRPAIVENIDVVQIRDDHHRRPHHGHVSRDRHDRYAHHERVRRGYYHGYRGYHEHRRGYRRHSDGFWYPVAAFALGAVIGGAITTR